MIKRGLVRACISLFGSDTHVPTLGQTRHATRHGGAGHLLTCFFGLLAYLHLLWLSTIICFIQSVMVELCAQRAAKLRQGGTDDSDFLKVWRVWCLCRVCVIDE